MPWSVAVDTLPKPTAKIEMPLDFTVPAALIAADEPPLTVCSPSLRSTITRGRPDEEPTSRLWPRLRPAPMFVEPDAW